MWCDLLDYIPLFLCTIMLSFISFVSWMTYKKAPLIKVRQKVQRRKLTKPITKSEEDEWAHENKKNRSNIDLD